MSAAAFRIHRLRVEGFKAFTAPQTIEIGGHVFVFGRNGLGKSSVVEAIRWCLFGLAGRPEAEVRNVFYSAGECKVELELEGPGGRWSVQRHLRPGARKSRPSIHKPDGTPVKQQDVFPGLARLGPHEGTHIIFASQQSTRRRPQADISDFDKVLYSYLQIDDVPDLVDCLKREHEENAETQRKLAKNVDDVEESLRSELEVLRGRIEEILTAAPWPDETVPTKRDTDARIRSFVKDCGGSLEPADGGAVTQEWLVEEGGRALEKLSAGTEKTKQRELAQARVDLSEFVTSKNTFEQIEGELNAVQDRVKSCERDLTEALGKDTKQSLLRYHEELVRKGNQLVRNSALGKQAAAYYDEFSPTECPVCGTSGDPADVLSLLGRIRIDDSTAELDEALTRVGTGLRTIAEAEAALVGAKEAVALVESKFATARDRLKELLDDPADLTSRDRKFDRLAERVRQLESELREAGSLVATNRAALKNLEAEARFHGYRSREERLLGKLGSGLEPARQALRDFTDLLDTLHFVLEALQVSFNNTLDRTLPRINQLMTEVYGRLTRQASFPKIVAESGPTAEKRSLRVRVTSDRTPEESFQPSEVLNGQAFSALNLVPYFVFSQFQSEALELDCLLIDDPSQSFDTSRVKLLLRELATAATHAQVIVASHEEERFAPFVDKYFPSGSYRVLRVTSFAPDRGPKLE